MIVVLGDGVGYEFAPVRYTRQVCRLVELFEMVFSGDEKSTKKNAAEIASLPRLMRDVMESSLITAGSTPEAADEALSTLPMGKELWKTYLPKIMEAMGLWPGSDEDEKEA